MGNQQAVVYITRVSKFLPNNAVSNDQMETYLGQINGTPSKARRIILRNNGIKQRYYALDHKGRPTHSNAELTHRAIENLFDDDFTAQDMEVLSVGTSSPDQIAPSHAAMVHGLLANKNLEINAAAGICCAGISSLKYGYMSVKSQNSNNAVCTGSERVSTWMQADKYQMETENLKLLEQQPIIAFKKDFLRWMLSDGAGAVLLENKKNKQGISLRIDWIENFSYAHELDVCMYAGAEKQEDGRLKAWSEYTTQQWLEHSIFAVKQDVKLLDDHILEKGVDSIRKAFAKHQLDERQINYFLPHISSYYFAEKLNEIFKFNGLQIPDEAWFTNLDKVGNIGSASIYVMLEELFHSGRLKQGDRIVLCVPESGRFSYAYVHLTVCI